MSENSSNSPRGQYDPGWNDPPKLQYTATQTGRTKLNLNKRIAFPLHGAATTSKPTAIVQPSPSAHPTATIPILPAQPPVAIVPPMPHCNIPPTQRVPPLNTSESNSPLDFSSDTRSEEEIIPVNAREFCVNVFQSFVPRIQDTNNIRSDEVQRRISLMNQMWLSGTLTSSVHRKLLSIAKALQSSNFNEAIENHRALVVEHSNVCTAWAAALRHIILTIQGYSENLSAHSPTSNILVHTAISSDTQRRDDIYSEPSDNIQHI